MTYGINTFDINCIIITSKKSYLYIVHEIILIHSSAMYLNDKVHYEVEY